MAHKQTKAEQKVLADQKKEIDLLKKAEAKSAKNIADLQAKLDAVTAERDANQSSTAEPRRKRTRLQSPYVPPPGLASLMLGGSNPIAAVLPPVSGTPSAAGGDTFMDYNDFEPGNKFITSLVALVGVNGVPYETTLEGFSFQCAQQNRFYPDERTLSLICQGIMNYGNLDPFMHRTPAEMTLMMGNRGKKSHSFTVDSSGMLQIGSSEALAAGEHTSAEKLIAIGNVALAYIMMHGPGGMGYNLTRLSAFIARAMIDNKITDEAWCSEYVSSSYFEIMKPFESHTQCRDAALLEQMLKLDRTFMANFILGKRTEALYAQAKGGPRPQPPPAAGTLTTPKVAAKKKPTPAPAVRPVAVPQQKQQDRYEWKQYIRPDICMQFNQNNRICARPGCDRAATGHVCGKCGLATCQKVFSSC